MRFIVTVEKEFVKLLSFVAGVKDTSPVAGIILPSANVLDVDDNEIFGVVWRGWAEYDNLAVIQTTTKQILAWCGVAGFGKANKISRKEFANVKQ